MSFSSDVKEECAKIIPEEKHCLKAELAGFLLSEEGVVPDKKTLEKPCCKRAFIRACFLRSGTVSDPNRMYHLELSAKNEDISKLYVSLLDTFDVEFKTGSRGGKPIVYLKDGNQLADFLNVIEATRSYLQFENIRVLKNVGNRINREVNCETANIRKTAAAYQGSLLDIQRIEATIGLENLPPVLLEAARIRMEHPDASLTEMGALMDPPVGKSGMNHRFRKLHSIAEGKESIS